MKKFKTINEEIEENSKKHITKSGLFDWRRRGNTTLERKFLKQHFKGKTIKTWPEPLEGKNITNLNLIMPTTLLNLFHADDMAQILCKLDVKFSVLGYINGHRERASLFKIGKHQFYLHANGIVREDFIVWTPRFPEELRFKILREMCLDKLRWNKRYSENQIKEGESVLSDKKAKAVKKQIYNKRLMQHYQDEADYCDKLMEKVFNNVQTIKDIEDIGKIYWRFVKKQYDKRVKLRKSKKNKEVNPQ